MNTPINPTPTNFLPNDLGLLTLGEVLNWCKWFEDELKEVKHEPDKVFIYEHKIKRINEYLVKVGAIEL